MTTKRTIKKDITALLCGQTTYVFNSRSQYFCELPKSYELWDKVNGLDYRIARIPKSRVLFVSTDTEFLPTDEWIKEREAAKVQS